MIHVARAPVRLTLGGGGTDYPSHYTRFGGHSVGLAIDRYVVVSIASKPWTDEVEVRSLRHERAAAVADIGDELTRAALELSDVTGGVQVVVAEDVPIGTGVGSSSAYVVALLAAASALTGRRRSPTELAEDACTVEMQRLGRDVGKQDQYLSALGGMQSLEFGRDGTVTAHDISPDGRLGQALCERLRLYWNGGSRLGHQVRSEQMQAVAASTERRRHHDRLMERIAQLGRLSVDALRAGDFDAWGELLHEHWCAKRKLGVANSCFPDELYDKLREQASVLGGKLVGAGGNGLVLLYGNGDARVVDAWMGEAGFRPVAFGPARHGVEVVTDDKEPCDPGS